MSPNAGLAHETFRAKEMRYQLFFLCCYGCGSLYACACDPCFLGVRGGGGGHDTIYTS